MPPLLSTLFLDELADVETIGHGAQLSLSKPATDEETSILGSSSPSKRLGQDRGLLSEGSSVSDEEEGIGAQSVSGAEADCGKHGLRPARVKRRKLSHVAIIGPAYPLSAYQSDDASPDMLPESEIILDLTKAHENAVLQSEGNGSYICLEVNDYSIYRPLSQGRKRHRGELVSLDRLLRHSDGAEYYLLDGVVSCGARKHRLQRVPFSVLAVDGYGDLGSFRLASLCLQSRTAARYGVWYQLIEPSREYRRFWKPFVWLAHFTKLFMEYLLASELKVDLRQFRADGTFCQWAREHYGRSDDYQRWLNDAPQDFRTTVAANVGYLWKECASIEKRLCTHPVWGEVDPLALKAIPREPSLETRTVVTRFAYDCFRHMYFARQLKPVPIDSIAVLERVTRRKEQLRLTPLGTPGTRQLSELTPESLTEGGGEPFDASGVHAGDVVSVVPDNDGPWKSVHPWYAYIQCVRPSTRGNVLDVLWLYHPSDTTLGAANYPFANERFLSDNCNCGKDAIDAVRVIRKIEVKWYKRNPGSSKGVFVRQKFRTNAEDDDYSFESLKPSDFKCRCTTNSRQDEWADCIRQFSPGDMALVRVHYRQWNKDFKANEHEETSNESDYSAELEESNRDIRLEPAQVIAFNHETKHVTIRHFQRASEQDSSARPNELVPTSMTCKVRATSIIRKCHVRFYHNATDIPMPYTLDGSCDFFYIFGAPDQVSQFPHILQGFDPSVPREKLSGLGIFCGGGNLDRGLEDGGAVEFKYAVDYNEQALHSYRASSRGDDVHYFLGSVDDYLALALKGSKKANVAQAGAISILAAGSPCPGFSTLQIDKLSEQSLKNASMIASVIAFVDFYSPERFFLENVVAMTTGHGKNKDENVFSQLLTALVALGYQVQQFLMDSWSYGSAQQRSRVFIVATAPGLSLLSHPPHSHDHPTYVEFSERSLGRSSNGLRFGRRRDHHAPFPCFTPAQACHDLPEVGDSQPQLCSKFPDHRTVTEEGFDSRTKMRLIPVRPGGMGLIQAHKAGYITGGEPLEYMKKLGKLQLTPTSLTYARAYADRLVPTLTTACHIRDGISGRDLHWAEHRALTVQECRRIQGYPDSEVLVGTPAQQMRTIGNSVDRKVPLALGIALREAIDRREEQLHDASRIVYANAETRAVTMQNLGPSKARGSEVHGQVKCPETCSRSVAGHGNTVAGTRTSSIDAVIPRHRTSGLTVSGWGGSLTPKDQPKRLSMP